MNEPEYWIGGLLVLVSLFASTANLALREFSRIKLQETLEARRKGHRLDWILKTRDELVLAMAALRMTTNVGVILSTVAILVPAQGPISLLHWTEALLVSAAVLQIFSVAVPHAWAAHAAESYVSGVYPLLRLLRIVLIPLTRPMHGVDIVVRRLAGVPPESAETANGEGREEVEREILDAVSEGELQGTVDEDEKEMIESVIDLRDTPVERIMTPRTDMITVDANASLDEVKQIILRHGHSRLPVCDGSLDHINGVLYAKDLLQIDPNGPFDVRAVMRPVPFVPESKSLRDLLHDFQNNKVHLAIVLDEYGGTAGLVTIEDILEEVVGEIADEYDQTEPVEWKQVAPDVWEVEGRMHIDELNDVADLEIPEDEDFDTVAGFVFSELGYIPAVGERLETRGARFTVLAADERKISRLKVEAMRESGEDDE